MEYFMTFLHKEIGQTEKLKNSFTLRVLRSHLVIIKKDIPTCIIYMQPTVYKEDDYFVENA